MISLTDSQKIGMGLTGFGVFFLFFGMMLFFDKALLAIGNILFVAGLSFVIGLERTFRFFFQKHKAKATGFFLGGVLVVLIGWPVVGVVLEFYGFFLLFRGFFPVVVGFIRRIPVLGSILNLPFISGGLRSVLLAHLLTVLMLAALLSLSWSAPKSSFQRRNWTPQAMLYLKGTQSRGLTPEKQNQNQAAAVLLNFLQQVKDEANDNAEQMYFQELPVWKREYF
ncbi:hypothetical protein NHX12_020294 [Muraenolepis orangiensis]|uniref:Vesicle transport protein GOT1B n=1 Tax=Muraenolepis orangiensis TaxID=630683 RepID=A0A9Q0EUL7_9TELE|nr:hypothetical protein NHX12_020294 [Muraenolepis orangiensis]